MINSLTVGGKIIEISDNRGRRLIQKTHWEFVQGEFNTLNLCSHEYEHEHVGYHFASFLMEI